MTALVAFENPECETLRVPVLKVFDGDGFLTRLRVPRRNADMDLSVRFGFIDAPEMEQPGGLEARDFLTSLIGGRTVDIAILTKMDTGGIVDRHGRVVCVPYLIDDPIPPRPGDTFIRRFLRNRAESPVSRNIELEMVLNGWAWVLTRYGPDDSYLDALSDARSHGRGIWARDANEHPWQFKKRRYRNRPARSASPPAPDLFDVKAPPAPCSNADCGGQLVERSGRFGVFYGCTNIPRCRCSRLSSS